MKTKHTCRYDVNGDPICENEFKTDPKLGGYILRTFGEDVDSEQENTRRTVLFHQKEIEKHQSEIHKLEKYE